MPPRPPAPLMSTWFMSQRVRVRAVTQPLTPTVFTSAVWPAIKKQLRVPRVWEFRQKTQRREKKKNDRTTTIMPPRSLAVRLGSWFLHLLVSDSEPKKTPKQYKTNEKEKKKKKKQQDLENNERVIGRSNKFGERKRENRWQTCVGLMSMNYEWAQTDNSLEMRREIEDVTCDFCLNEIVTGVQEMMGPLLSVKRSIFHIHIHIALPHKT